jgi:prolyl-tRNA editing enzyme YbaK/EbsC (Cys-tRNA(Pro) deacylase)
VSLPRSARRVEAALLEAGIPAGVVELADSARTAAEAAAAVGVELGAIVKSLVFRGGSGAAVLALVAGDRRADEAAVAAAAGDSIGRADADFVRAATGFAIGGVPPLGHGLVPLVDASLMRFEEVWAAAGTPHHVFGVSPTRLVQVTGGRVVQLSSPSSS